MPRKLVTALCPACKERWDANPDELPAPAEEFECPECGERRRTSDFMETPRDHYFLSRSQ